MRTEKEVDQREKDIQELITGVLQTSSVFYSNYNGREDSSCPFCYERVYGEGNLTDITHSQDCIYLIAKDLNTK